MSRSLNNFCESLVNGSNPRYIGSQPTLSEQVAWQLKKEEEARQALYKESTLMDEKKRSKSSSTYTPAYTSTYSYPTYSAPTYLAYPSFNCTNYGRVI